MRNNASQPEREPIGIRATLTIDSLTTVWGFADGRSSTLIVLRCNGWLWVVACPLRPRAVSGGPSHDVAGASGSTGPRVVRVFSFLVLVGVVTGGQGRPGVPCLPDGGERDRPGPGAVQMQGVPAGVGAQSGG